MKISVDWLNSYLDQPVAADAMDRLLTEQVFPIDAHEPVDGGDTMLDVEVTSNRPDCLSHLGLAREVAAGTGCELKVPYIALPGGAADVNELTAVDNQAPDLCPLYTARVITGVKVGPSPDWLARRLTAIGLRPINNVVDVTNFVLHELGQPLHAFDMAKLAERRIVVRRARKDEPITAIDGSRHQLAESMLVIADADRPVAVAGVMGGLDSEVTESTSDILLESAMFEPLNVRSTSRSLKLASDSSYRFERGVDPVGVETASQRAAALIIELAGGQLAKGVIRSGMEPPRPHVVTMRPSRCCALLGVAIDTPTMVGYLDRLGLSAAVQGDAIACTIPTFRLDLHREVDLIEEVGRLHGVGDVPVQEKIHIVARPMQPIVAARRRLNEVLIAHGYHETINFSFVNPKMGEPFVEPNAEPVMVDDERRKSEPMLRPSLLPSLLICRKRNQDAGNRDVRLAESACVWNKRDGKVVEQRRLALLADAEDASTALRQLRGTLEELASHLLGDANALRITPTNSDDPQETRGYFATAGRIALNDRSIGFLGLIAPRTQSLFDLQTATVAAELNIDALLGSYPPVREVRALPRYPGIERDLSIVVNETVTWADVESQVEAAQPALLEKVNFLMTYRGKPIPPGLKSLSFRMLFRDPGKTLRHDEVDPQVETVITRLKSNLQAELRV